MKKKSIFRLFMSFVLMLICSLVGAGNYVMAAAGDAEAGTGGENGTGVGAADGAGDRTEVGTTGTATYTEGQHFADPDWYTKFIDSEITKVQPTSTPLHQLVSYAKKKSGKSLIVKYYSWGYRPYKTTVGAGMQAFQGDRVVLPVADAGIFTVDDTILVLGVHGYTPDGLTLTPNQDLELSVCEIEKTTGMPVVYAVNGQDTETFGNIGVPTLPAGTKLLRMAKAAGELDAQTGKYYSKPKAQTNNVQKFMCQVEASHIEKIHEHELSNFTWSDVEEEAIMDMKRTMEFTYMWGVKGEHVHEGKQGTVWFTQGIWSMAGKEIQVGNYVNGKDLITEDDLVDVLKDMFVGTNLGGKQKVLLCGSDFLAALSKIKSDRLVYRETVDKFGLKFKSFDSEFGELLAVHAEFMNAAEKSKWAFAMDPDYLRKYTFRPWGRNVIDKNAIGVSETEAAIIREMSCVYLTYAAAHARLFLASAIGDAHPTVNEEVNKQSQQKVVRPTNDVATVGETEPTEPDGPVVDEDNV